MIQAKLADISGPHKAQAPAPTPAPAQTANGGPGRWATREASRGDAASSLDAEGAARAALALEAAQAKRDARAAARAAARG